MLARKAFTYNVLPSVWKLMQSRLLQQSCLQAATPDTLETEILFKTEYEGRRKSSRPNHERGIFGEILFPIFERIYFPTLHKSRE